MDFHNAMNGILAGMQGTQVGNIYATASGMTPMPAATASASGPMMQAQTLLDQTRNASGSLAAYMNEKGMGAINVNQLYDISSNKAGNVPEDVQKAAGFMLKHPEIYKAIETSDVSGADGISGVNNFETAAQGTPTANQLATVMKSLVNPQSSALSMAEQAREASGALTAYMNEKKMGAVNVNQLNDLSNNKGGNVPEDVQKAAGFMVKNPEIYKKIETSDVASVDGISGVRNFSKVAQGLIQV